MAEMPTATVELQPSPDLTALVDRLANLMGQLEGCAVRVLNLQPDDVIVLETPKRIPEPAYIRLKQTAEMLWPNNRLAILEDGMRATGVTREVGPIIKTAIALFRGEYDDLEGIIKLPWSDEQEAVRVKLFALRDALKAAGYEWETLT